MKILDCESLESTYKSLEIILGINKTQLNFIFDKIDLEDEYYVRKQLLFEVNKHTASINFDAVCWFHLTRIPTNIDFSEGILPLQLGIERIWEILYSFTENVSRNEWNDFKELMNTSSVLQENKDCSNSHYLFNLKTKNHYLCGPYAMLIKEIAFYSNQISNHDYLKIPEIIEDICVCFESNHKFNLTEKYINQTKSCIVKFISNQTRNDLLDTALYYLYCVYKGYGLSLNCNTCFDGKGITISRESILAIDWVENY